MEKIKWHFRNNSKRKKGSSGKGKHPSLIVGETDDGSSYVNIGLTKSPKRGIIKISKYIIHKIGMKIHI